MAGSIHLFSIRLLLQYTGIVLGTKSNKSFGMSGQDSEANDRGISHIILSMTQLMHGSQRGYIDDRQYWKFCGGLSNGLNMHWYIKDMP